MTQDLSATRQPYKRTDYGDGVDRRRYASPKIGRAHRDQRQRDRADDRDQEDRPDREDDEQDVE